MASPLTVGLIAYLIFRSVQWLILEREDPLARARKYVPVYMFLAAFNITLVTIFKGLKHVGLHLSTVEAYSSAVIIGVAVAIIGRIFIGRITSDKRADKRFHFHTVERVFGVLMIVTACGMAFAHGSNDVANAIGPLAAVVSIADSGVIGQNLRSPSGCCYWAVPASSSAWPRLASA